MKGYKATDKNMCCRGFKYELGKTHEVKGKLEICKKGFHFCEKLIAIDECYDLSTSRVFEVEATGDIQEERLKFCTNEIKFIRELSKEEIIKLANEAVNDVDVYIHEILAKSKLALPETLEILSKEPSVYTRGLVAENLNSSKKTLKLLSQDKCWLVRAGVALNLNTSEEVLKCLSQDEDFEVRAGVALNLNTSEEVLKCLSQDKNFEVRACVARNVNASEKVLEELSRDGNVDVKWAAAENLNTRKKTLEELSRDIKSNEIFATGLKISFKIK